MPRSALRPYGTWHRHPLPRIAKPRTIQGLAPGTGMAQAPRRSLGFRTLSTCQRTGSAMEQAWRNLGTSRGTGVAQAPGCARPCGRWLHPCRRARSPHSRVGLRAGAHKMERHRPSPNPWKLIARTVPLRGARQSVCRPYWQGSPARPVSAPLRRTVAPRTGRSAPSSGCHCSASAEQCWDRTGTSARLPLQTPRRRTNQATRPRHTRDRFSVTAATGEGSNAAAQNRSLRATLGKPQRGRRRKRTKPTGSARAAE